MTTHATVPTDRKEIEILYTKDGQPVYVPKKMLTTTINGSGREVMVINGTNPALLGHNLIPYNEVTAMAICDHVLEGLTLSKIGKMPGMPNLRTIYRWQAKNDEFAQYLEKARKFRAEFFADKVIESVDDGKLETKEDIEKAKVKMSAYKWGAEKGDAKRYGSNQKAEVQGPAKIIISTGIDRGKPVIKIDGEPV